MYAGYGMLESTMNGGTTAAKRWKDSGHDHHGYKRNYAIGYLIIIIISHVSGIRGDFRGTHSLCKDNLKRRSNNLLEKK